MKRTRRKSLRKPFDTVKVGNIVVPIYRRDRPTTTGKFRPVFEVADHTRGVRQLLGFADCAKARKKAEGIARQLSTGEVTAATMRNSDAASYGRAVELIRPTGLALEVAAGIVAQIHEILGGNDGIEAARFYKRHRADRVTRKPIAEVIVELIAAKAARGKSDTYLSDLRQRLIRFAKFYGADASTIDEPEAKEQPDRRNRGVDVSTITTTDVQRWLDGLKLAPQSAKNFRTVLHTLFSFAESRGYIFKGGNPVAATESISVNGGDIQIFTPAEITALLKAAPREFRPLIALGGFAGLRTAEILRLEWCEITDGYIHISRDNAKTRSRRLVPVLPNLAALLVPYAKRPGKVWKGSANDLQDARAVAVKGSGVAWKDNGLRHSFISYRLADIQDAAQVALEAGNSPNVVFRHYRELVKPDDARAWFAVRPEDPISIVGVLKPAA